ncbi:diguanylate cyclase (GGDEF)-like protein [Planomicrobium stackebrandtii]|uniref:Diguanylate cyclase (GGDEF)-like protein n=1 Tax=Planomicrobium stackebrandtii TaxID=253160 RepID=A0ABU0GVV7_9BACL|nr:DUF4084 domain-containing protein [Planomicrobium stackebrandtii]MDQ0429498.1 diguanylate cyclase (GGDEF)-like protein [Planomicrobium stackebrandtii]
MKKINPSKTKNLFAGFILLHISVYYGWIIFGGTGSSQLLGLHLLSWIAPLAAAITLLTVYLKSAGRDRYFWLLASLGCLSYTIAESIWLYSHIATNSEVAYPGWPDLFYFLQMFFYIAAFAHQILQKKESAYQIKFLFDMAVLVSVSTALSWHFLISPLVAGSSTPLLFAVSIGYPVGDLLLLFGAISLYIGSLHFFPRRVLALIVAGLIVQVIADNVHLYSTIAGSYSYGNLYDPLWSFGLLLMALASLQALETSEETVSQTAIALPDGKITLRLLLPYFSMILLFVVMIFEQRGEMNGLIAGAGASVLLLITRQIFTLRNNQKLLYQYHSLTSVLEHKIEQRTEEITSKNHQLEKAVQQMKHMAYHDVLSGLPNRRLFLEKLETSIFEAAQSSKKVAVVFIDLDRFKNVNDTFGHEFGDLLLRRFSQKISENLRSNDVISRQGGDEFTLILNDIQTENDIVPMIHRLQSALSMPLTVNEQELHISMSIGISVFPKDGDTTEELLKHADSAMYRAKENGKNSYQFFTDEMAFTSSRKIALENDLRRAITYDEFILHYQPQVQTSTGEIIGMEALIRWQKAAGDVISPGEFIPLAEETRLILPMGEWVLYTACRQAKEWHDAGFSQLKLAVNLSPLQFAQDDLLYTIEQALEQTGFPASSLELEITESVAVDDAEKAIFRMQALRQLGVQIAIDDFGTGYSSLSYLKRFPLNNLKIAQPFVQDMAANLDDKALVEAMIFIAHSLDMSVIAEGVETEEQLALLKELDCDEIQGYFYSKPLTAEKFTALLASGLSSQSVM